MPESALEQIEKLVDRYDAEFKVDVGSLTAWSGFLRLTLTDPRDAPSRSITFFSAGAGSPEEVAERVVADYREWSKTAAKPPLPVPDWMK